MSFANIFVHVAEDFWYVLCFYVVIYTLLYSVSCTTMVQRIGVFKVNHCYGYTCSPWLVGFTVDNLKGDNATWRRAASSYKSKIYTRH